MSQAQSTPKKGERSQQIGTHRTEEAPNERLVSSSGIALGVPSRSMRVWSSGTGGCSHVSPLGQLLSFNVSVGGHRPNVRD